MDKYAICKIAKLKSVKALSDAYKHNERIFDVTNADPARRDQNVELIDANGIAYEELVTDTLNDLIAEGRARKTVRKDAILGLEVMLTFSREHADQIEIEKWAEENIKWLDETFNPPNHEVTFLNTDTGKEKTIKVQNIKHAILHMDESNPHIHAFVVPINEKGMLNAHSYYDGRYDLIKIQSDYAKRMKPFGLERGEMHSTAKPEKIARYYNHLLKAVDAQLPMPQPGETLEAYKERADEVYQIAMSNHRNEIVKMNQQIVHAKSVAGKETAGIKREQKEERKILENLEKLLEDVPERERSQVVYEAVDKMQKFEKAAELYPDPAISEQAMRLFLAMIEWVEEQERKQKEQEREEEEREEEARSQNRDNDRMIR